MIKNLFPNLDIDKIKNHIIVEDKDTDHLFHLCGKNCKLFKRLLSHAGESEHQKYINDFVEYVTRKYLKDLSVGMIDNEDSTMTPLHIKKEEDKLLLKHGKKLCNYVYWAHK